MNRAAAAYFGVILLCAGLQVGPAEALKFLGVKPDLLIMTALMSAVFFRPGWALAHALAAGTVKDCLGVPYYGLPYAVTFLLLTMTALAVTRRISVDKWWLRFLLVFCLVNAGNLAVRLWVFLSGGTPVRFYIFVKVSFLESALTALCAAVFFERDLLYRAKRYMGTIKGRCLPLRKPAAGKGRG